MEIAPLSLESIGPAIPDWEPKLNADTVYDEQPSTARFAIPSFASYKQTQARVPYVTTEIFNTKMGHTPVEMRCPFCRKKIVTNVESFPNVTTCMWAILFCGFGGLIGSCIPFCVDALNQQDHICPKCEKTVGKNNI